MKLPPLSLRKVAGHLITPEIIKLMKDWVKDCNWRETEDDDDSNSFVDSLSDEQIIRGVEKHYDGGVAGFLAAL